jgi:hypothetical protein
MAQVAVTAAIPRAIELLNQLKDQGALKGLSGVSFIFRGTDESMKVFVAFCEYHTQNPPAGNSFSHALRRYGTSDLHKATLSWDSEKPA